ncbi:MAG TPA: hypothetical protein VFH54_16975 [Mycobacteriales bacterium]|nr:hypothetical protein [Mycobacteriales bacterium]
MRFTGTLVRCRAAAGYLLVVLMPVGLLGGCSSGGGVLASDGVKCTTAPYLPAVTAGGVGLPPLPGPARADVTNGLFVHPLRLDDDGLVVNPPAPQPRPRFSGDTALCQVFASTLSNGAPVGRQPRDSVAVGLGRVTVRDVLLDKTRLGSITEYGSIDGIPNVNPRHPAPKPYHDRLAWVVVVQDIESSSCGAGGPNSTPPPRHLDPSLHGYAVFVVDAGSGSDALLYTERMNPICPGGYPSGPWVDVPLTSTSIAWRLVSRQPDNTRGVVSFQAAACDGYAGVIAAGNSAPPNVVRVLVTRPFGSPCPPIRTVTEKLRARNVGALLPDRLQHAPLGPYFGD